MAKYDPLRAYLARRGPGEVELGFAEVERIIGSELPPGVSRPVWWTNPGSDDHGPVQSRAWRSAGYEAFLLPGSRILFRRRVD